MKIHVYKRGQLWWALVASPGSVMLDHHETWAAAMQWAEWAVQMVKKEAQVGR